MRVEREQRFPRRPARGTAVAREVQCANQTSEGTPSIRSCRIYNLFSHDIPMVEYGLAGI